MKDGGRAGKLSLKRLLLEEVAGFMANYGFTKRYSEQSFFRSLNFGRRSFHLAFIPHRGVDCDVTADVAIRVDAVEDILNSRRDNLSAKDGSRTATLGSELGNLTSGKQRRWTMASEKDIREVASAIDREFKTVAIPFFERFSDMEAIFVALSSHEQKDWIISPVYSWRCQRAVVLAYVLGKRQEFEILLQDCEKSLRARNDQGLEEFLELSRFLQGKFPAS